MLYRIWQGKSGVINIIVPILILTFLYICDKKDITVTDIIFTGMVLVAGLHATSVGIYLVPVAYFALVAGNFLIYRNIKNACKLVVPVGIVMPFVLLKAYALCGWYVCSGVSKSDKVWSRILSEELFSWQI